MNITCNDCQRILLDGRAEEWAALEAHAATCAACGEEVRSWKNLSLAAADLRQEWESPELWPRIEQALAQNAKPRKFAWWDLSAWNFAWLEWQAALAGLLLMLMTGFAGWMFLHRGAREIPANQALFDPSTVREVEKAEAAYERAIDRLDAEARPQLEQASTPLMVSYREKLLVVDSAISELRSQAGMNPGNGHLRRQLLAMYREKQDTLEQVLEAKQ